MNIKTFFTPQYLFHVNTAFISPNEKLFLLFGGMLILISIVLKISSSLAPAPVDAKYRAKFYRLFLTIGIFEVIWYLFRYENVIFFDTPFVAWMIILIGLIWLGFVITSLVKHYREEKTNWEKQQVRQKYLPQ